MTEGILLAFNFESSTLANVCLMGRPALAFAHRNNKMNFFSDFIFRRNAIVGCGVSFDCRECSIVVNHSYYLISNVVSHNKIPPFILLGISLPGRIMPILKSVS